MLYGDSQYDREETVVPKVTSVLSVFYGIYGMRLDKNLKQVCFYTFDFTYICIM